MKNKIIAILVIISLLLTGLCTVQFIQNNNLDHRYQIAVQNNSAYEYQLKEEQDKNIAFQFTVDQLQYLNDKTVHELDSMRVELGIKDNKIKQLQRLKQNIYINDTIFIYDTIFDNQDFAIDTCIGDEWYQNCFHMEYPNQITSSVSVNNELSCFLYTVRETIDPPCKTWIGRLFQRKHNVNHVIVIEHNPYSKIHENKFIIIND